MVLEFEANWSGPCARFAPKLEKIYGEFDDVATVSRLNIEYAKALAMRQEVNEVPELRFYRDGRLVGRLLGDVDEDVLREKFTELTRELRAVAMAAPPKGTEASSPAEQPSIQRMKKDWMPSGLKHR